MTTTHVEFEGTGIPVPGDYHDFLVDLYGPDYNTLVQNNVHSALFDPEVLYVEYYEDPSKYNVRVNVGLD